MNELERGADPERHRPNQHKREIGHRAGERHQGSTMRMTARPEWVIRGAGETDHLAAQQKEAKQRKNDHAVR